MLAEQNVLMSKIGLSKEQQTHYLDLGYDLSKTKFEVNINDLAKGSRKKVKVICDYCLDDGVYSVYEQDYHTYWDLKDKSPIKKDACKLHRSQKTKDSNKLIYGTDNINTLVEIKEKIKQTNLSKYGVEYALQDKAIRDKGKETCKEKYGAEWYTQTQEYHDKVKSTNLEKYGTEYYMESDDFKQKTKETLSEKYGVDHVMHSEVFKNKIDETFIKRYGVKRYSQLPEWNDKMKDTLIEHYGVDNPLKSDEIKDKVKETNLEKYGVENPFQSEYIKAKIKETNLAKYGVENPSQNQEIRERINQTFYENGTAPCSTQQRYIHDVIGGELNYPIGNNTVDIAYVDLRIYIECDFSGHWLAIELGKETVNEFNNRQRRRWYYLNKKDWREIRIISKNDLIPNNDKIKEMIRYAIDYLNQGHSYIKFDIDNKMVMSSQFKCQYDFGTLKKISKRNLDKTLN
jgi:hypothetical protein